MFKTKSEIKTRFAPSPTGFMHLGNLRALIFSYLFARKNNGIFLLRIDDTDKARYKNEYEGDIYENLKWLNVSPDYKIVQSQNTERYDKVFNLLKENNLIYECSETKEDLENIQAIKKAQKKAPIITKKDRIQTSNFRENTYWRFEITKDQFFFTDIIQGNFSFHKVWSDPVIKKPDGSYTYTFTSVIDDIEEKITHIIRGEDHISNTVYQKELGNAIVKLFYQENSWNVEFAHYSMFLNEEGAKLSKRDLSTSLREIREDVEQWTIWSILTYLGTSQNQIFSNNIEDYIINFDLNKISRSKQHFQSEIIDKTNKKIFNLSNPSEFDVNLWNLLKDNANSISHLKEMAFNLDKLKKKSALLSII